MMNRECSHLDEFLSGDLPDEQAVCFPAHLSECEACRDAVDQQRWIEGLLRSPLRLELEPAPIGIGTKIGDLIVRRRKARLAACGFAAAAVLFVAASWIIGLTRQAGDESQSASLQQVIAEAEPSPGPTLQERGNAEPSRAVFDGGDDLFVAAVESRHPNVTIVRLYPTYKPSLASEANIESSDADHFNGG